MCLLLTFTGTVTSHILDLVTTWSGLFLIFSATMTLLTLFQGLTCIIGISVNKLTVKDRKARIADVYQHSPGAKSRTPRNITRNSSPFLLYLSPENIGKICFVFYL
jgi:hypothetical protein